MLAFAMPVLTRAQVEAVAALAHLELEPGEVEMFARQLGDILAYADEVRQVDTADVPPTAPAAARVESDRPEEVRPCLDPADEVFGNAPDATVPPELRRPGGSSVTFIALLPRDGQMKTGR
jgi:aspartyl-tRNA(Asn)/glutamyl-tRNA(Gln) amidotransferase subunit C